MEEIITLPDPRLRQKSEPILKVDQKIKDLIKRMENAALDWEKNRPNELSTALAAVQIGEPKRLIIIREDMEHKTAKFVALINPEIINFSGKKELDFEGCLSVPDFYAKVSRSSRIKVKAKNINGETIFIKAEGFIARTLQHEIDHTNGILFTDRVKNQRDAFYKLAPNGDLKKVDYETVIAAGIFRD